MGVGLLNVSSLIFGLIAWILPLISISRFEKEFKHWIAFTILSLSACSVSLLFQIWSFSERVRAEDWTALMDTVSIIALVPTTLLIVTIILNTVSLFMYRKNR